MEPVYLKKTEITGIYTDCFEYLTLSSLLRLVQEAAGEHSQLLEAGWEALQEKNLFWAMIRHRLQVERLPKKGEIVTLETWPMPTTRTAYPRSVIGYDQQGQVLFRSVSLWALMDPHSRSLVLPGKSGVQIQGILRGTELAAPGGLAQEAHCLQLSRSVRFTDLDINGHMNNTRYLDWVWDLLPSAFHRDHSPRNISLQYHAEAREGDVLDLQWSLTPEGSLRADALRRDADTQHRIFSAHIDFV